MRLRFIAQFAIHQEILPNFDSIHLSSVISTKTEEKGISGMPRSILRFSISKFNLVFGPRTKNLKAGLFLLFLFWDNLWSLLCFFGSLFRSYLADKNKKLRRPAFSLWVGAWSTSCRKITPKYVKLNGAWQIYLSGSYLAGPARTRSNYPTQLAKMSFDEILDLTANVFLFYNNC